MAAKRPPQAKWLADRKHELIPAMQSVSKRPKFNINNDDPTLQVGERFFNFPSYMSSPSPLSSSGMAPELNYGELDVATHDAPFEGSTIDTVGPMIGQLPDSQFPGIFSFGGQFFNGERFTMPSTTVSTAIGNPYPDTILRAPYFQYFEKIHIKGIHPMDFLAIYCFPGKPLTIQGQNMADLQ